MANYYGSTRTNYFKVIDVEAFKELLAKCATQEGECLPVWTREGENGETLYGFGCYDVIEGLPLGEEEDCEYSYDAFIKELQKLLPEGEAVIITQVGNEKLRYLGGDVTIITKDKSEYMTLHKIGLEKAREMLNNPEWDTQDEY